MTEKKPWIDLNADLGEGAGNDVEIMNFVTSANISCGAHAGDEKSIRTALRAAGERNLAVGAHPGYPDRASKGRRELHLPPEELYRLLLEQLRFFSHLADAEGVRIGYLKPHGALYNQAMRDRSAAEPLLRAFNAWRAEEPGVRYLLVLAGSPLSDFAGDYGIATVREAFADRLYLPDGTLAPRALAGARIDSPSVAADRALRIARGETIPASDGREIRIDAQSICLHGDGPAAPEMARAIRSALVRGGVEIRNRLD